MHTDVWYDLVLRELAGEHGSAGELLREAEAAQAGDVEEDDEAEADQEADAKAELAAA